MLTGLGLRNFKAFGDEMQEAPLSKITLIYGPNSGGKSSIIQALLLLKQSLSPHNRFRNPNSRANLEISGGLVDLGSFQSLLHQHDSDRSLTLSISFTDSFLAGEGSNDVEMSFSEKYGAASLSEVIYKLTDCGFDDSLFEAAMTMDWLNGESEDTEHGSKPAVRISSPLLEILGITEGKDYNFDCEISYRYLPQLILRRASEQEHVNRYDRFVKARQAMRDLLDALDVARSAAADEDNRHKLSELNLTYDEILESMLKPIPIDYEIHLESLNYLAPLRSAPERLYRLSGENDASDGVTGVQGEFSANVLYRREEVLGAVNNWFAEFDIPYDIDAVKLGEASLAGEYITIALTDKRTNTQVTLADVGYGINQILPVIIEGIASRKNSILCVEQPEIHLHPRLQANIADLMIDTIADEPGKRKQWIVETHSELLILRLQRRIREGKIKPEDVSVLYVDPNEESVEGSVIKVLRLGEDSYFKDPWPDGFFAESLHEQLQPDADDNDSVQDTDVLDKLFMSE